MIDISNLSVSLSGKAIVHDIAFSAQPGRITAIIGPNGSGKTTTLKAIAGEIPYQGSIVLDGLEIARFKPWDLAIRRAVLPQSTVVSFPFTVMEIVAMGCLSSAPSLHLTRDRQIHEALDAVGLSGMTGRLYQDMSGGEQQRVQLARVLCQVREPVRDGKACFMFLDEPVSSLDIRHQIDILTLARRFCARGGGVLAIMHDLNLTAMFADRIIMMKGGRIVADGTPDEVMTDALIEDVFGCALRVGVVPSGNVPFVLPQTAAVNAH